MRILLLNLYYPPDTSATAKMAQFIAESLSSEHQVTVLCGRPSYDPGERRRWKLWQNETCGRVRVIRVGSAAYSRMRMKGRVLNYLSYVALSVVRALPIGCDVVLAMTDPPFEGIVGAFVALLKRKPYVYNIRDFYPDMAVGGSVIEAGLMSRVWETLHRWALRHVTRVIVLGEDMRDRVIAKGVTPERVAIVRDGTDIQREPCEQDSLDPEVIRAIRGNSKFVILHAGNLGFYGAWDTLIRAAADLANDGVSLVFVGDGAQRPQLQASAGSLSNVRFLPFFPSSKIFSVLHAADMHVVTIKRGLEGVVVPSKMYGILGAGRPMLAVAPKQTDAAALCDRLGCGVSCDPERPEEVVAAVRSLATDRLWLARMGEAAKLAAPNYDRVLEARKFADVLKEAAQA